LQPRWRRDRNSCRCSGDAVLRVRFAAQDDLEGFRRAVRALIARDASPEQVVWQLPGDEALFGDEPPPSGAPLMLPAAFAALAKDVACHRDRERFALLYTCVWRILHGEKALLAVASDPLVHRLARMQKAVRRDLHKMTAFVRFRRVEEAGGERYVAWFEPEHHILRQAAEFFRDRFAVMCWSILTPDGTLHWDGVDVALGPPVPRASAPQDDRLEDWWRTYYRATFNPARANPQAMRAEMPKKYWRNLPEAPLITDLLAQAAHRTAGMIEAPATAPRRAKVVAPAVLLPAPDDVPAATLPELAAQAKACERCPLYRDATQAVFGEGPQDAAVAFVGEQPGDQEDLAGRPFVGPAGEMFNRALARTGIDRGRVYVTNAVKHFKFTPRGKRRIHQKPNGHEVEQCRWWLDRELALLQPRLTVALGATAARALTGRDVTIARERGRIVELRPGLAGLITVHPSYLLRLPDEAARAHEYARFVQDLGLVAEHIPAIRRAA
jgi:probable DNA metabolism protein